MRFILGLIIGIALTVGAAAYHDNNIPPNPQTVADHAIVDWDALGAVTRGYREVVGRWWNQLLGRGANNRYPVTAALVSSMTRSTSPSVRSAWSGRLRTSPARRSE